MSERAPDPRSARTRATLLRALREVAAQVPLDEVSVSELCRRAGVRRTTFYSYASSVPALLTDLLLSDLDQRLEVDDTSGLSVEDTAREFHERLAAALAAVAEQRVLYLAALDATGSAPLRRGLADLFGRRLAYAIGIWREHGIALEVDDELAVAYGAGGLAAVLEAWARSESTDADAWAARVRDQLAPWWPRS